MPCHSSSVTAAPSSGSGREQGRGQRCRLRRTDVGRGLGGGERVVDAEQRHDAGRDQRLGHALRQAVGQGRQHRRPAAGRVARMLPGGERDLPVGVAAAVGAREIEDEAGEVPAAGHDRGEGRAQALGLAPDEDVVVERVGDGDQIAQRRAHRLALRGRERAEADPALCPGIGDQRRLAARAAQRDQVAAGQRPHRVQQLQRLEQDRQRGDPRDADPAQQRVHGGVGPGERGGVAERQRRTVLRAPGLDRDHGLPRRQRLAGGGVELRDVVDRLDVQADRGDARIVDQGGEAVRQPDAGLVAQRHQMPDRQPAPLHGQVEADIAGLGQDRDAALAAPAAMLVEPEQGAVEIVDRAVAVGAEDRHPARGRDQRLLQLRRPRPPDSRKPAAWQTAPPAPIAASSRTIPTVTSRLTATKAASGASGSSATLR